MLFAPKCRPPTGLYSTRSGPRAASAHSAAHWRTSARCSPICRADGPRIGRPRGSQSSPVANRRSRAPESHLLRTAARTSAGLVQVAGPPAGVPGRARTAGTSVPARGDEVADHDLLGELVRGPPGLVFLDRQRLQPRVVAPRVVHEAHRKHI